MRPSRTPLEAAAGKLISAIQREWHAEAGEPSALESEEVMHACHGLLKAAKNGSLSAVLGSKTVAQFLGTHWVAAHPNVSAVISELESAAQGQAGA